MHYFLLLSVFVYGTYGQTAPTLADLKKCKDEGQNCIEQCKAKLSSYNWNGIEECYKTHKAEVNSCLVKHSAPVGDADGCWGYRPADGESNSKSESKEAATTLEPESGDRKAKKAIYCYDKCHRKRDKQCRTQLQCKAIAPDGFWEAVKTCGTWKELKDCVKKAIAPETADN